MPIYTTTSQNPTGTASKKKFVVKPSSATRKTSAEISSDIDAVLSQLDSIDKKRKTNAYKNK